MRPPREFGILPLAGGARPRRTDGEDLSPPNHGVRVKPPAFPPRNWPRLPIRTRRLTLRLPERTDVPFVHRACAHWSTRWGVPLLPRPYRVEDAVEFVRRSRAQYRARRDVVLTVSGPDGAFVGVAGIWHPSLRNRVGELGYWIAPQARGQGFATEAARAMCALGFDTLRLHRIEARTFARNLASINVLRAVGFRREGLLRERTRVGARWLDEVWLARLSRGGSPAGDDRLPA